MVEMLIVVAIIAVAAMIAIPQFNAAARRRKVIKVTRMLRAHLMEGRSWASSRREIAPGVVANFGGVRVVGPTSYAIFADPDNIAGNGNEIDVKTIDLLLSDPGLGASIQTAPGTIVRFSSDGTATAMDLTVLDATINLQRIVRTNGAGRISIR